jgi:tetratricopeptide (TPR) repeat protein
MDKALLILPDRSDFLKRKGDLYIQEFNALDTGTHGFPLLIEAAKIYQTLVSASPDSAEYALTLVQLTYNVRDFDKCRQVVDQALVQHATHPELLNYAGKVRIQQGLALKTDEGKKLMGEASGFLNKAIELNPNDPMLVYNLALLYRDMGEPEKALATFGRIEALAQGRNDLLFDSWYSLAVLYFQDLPEGKQDPVKAADYFQKCLNLQPDNKGLKFNLGVALVRTGNKDNVTRGKKLMSEGQ